MILETARLTLRELEPGDLGALEEVLGDPIAMAAYEHGFEEDETHDWIDRRRRRYDVDGFGLWAVVLDGVVVGDAGLTRQRIEDDEVVEVGYHLRRDLWGRGYATEAAAACVAWGFERLDVGAIWAKVRDTNTRSRRVAERLGMTPRRTFAIHYRGVDMPHTGYALDRAEGTSRRCSQPRSRSQLRARRGEPSSVATGPLRPTTRGRRRVTIRPAPDADPGPRPAS